MLLLFGAVAGAEATTMCYNQQTGTDYETLQAAINAASSGDTIELVADPNILAQSSTVTMNRGAGFKITIDGEYRGVITRAAGFGGAIFNVLSGELDLYAVDVDGSSPNGTTITAPIAQVSGGTFSFDGGRIRDAAATGAVSAGIYAASTGNLIVDGTTMSGLSNTGAGGTALNLTGTGTYAIGPIISGCTNAGSRRGDNSGRRCPRGQAYPRN